MCAYYVSRGSANNTELKNFLLLELPEYMVPAIFCQMDKIPLTPNGKVDRKALPDVAYIDKKDSEKALPATQTQHYILDLFKKILAVEHLGVTDNFFEYGGTLEGNIAKHRTE